MLILKECPIEFVGADGSDNTVVDAARVSYAGRSEDFNEERNAKLIRRLLSGNPPHDSPFHLPGIRVRMAMPIFIMRELVRHRIGFEFNEVSRRYRSSDDVPLAGFVPKQWRMRKDAGNKQTSGGPAPIETSMEAEAVLTTFYEVAETAMRHLERIGIAKEQARLAMSVGMFTEIYARFSLSCVMRIYRMRVHPDAQPEINEMIRQFDDIMDAHFPVTWAIFKELRNAD